MRLILHLRPYKEQTRLPLQYNELIQGMIYGYLDRRLASFIHDHGMREGKRTLKLFTFSRLMGACAVRGRTLEISGGVRLVVASPMIDFLESFARHLVTAESLRIGPAIFGVESVEVGLDVPYKNPIVVTALSPICVYSTLRTPEGRTKTYYYAPSEPDFERLVLANLRRKVRIWTGVDMPDNGASIHPRRVMAQNHHVVFYKGTVIKAWSGLYELRLPEEYFRMALDAGLGAKNSQGFGCVGVWETAERQHRA